MQLHTESAQDLRIQSRTVAHTSVRYSAQQIANELEKSESTVRTRWFPWLLKVAPCPLLRDDAGYTELARTLFSEFAKVEQRDRPEWVLEAKQRYSQEWACAGVIEGELMPEEVGGTLALMQSSNLAVQAEIDLQLSELKDFISQLNSAEASLSQQELAAFRQAGIQRGLAQFQIETQAQQQVVNMLRQQRLGGQSDEPST